MATKIVRVLWQKLPNFLHWGAGTPAAYLNFLTLGNRGSYMSFRRLLVGKPTWAMSCAAFIALMGVESWAAFGFKLDGTLDKDAISHAYFEGEFSRVMPPLEMFRQSFPGNATRDDSIFVYKYLSVIYAADSSTRPKAESFMVQLVKMKPTIELIDLYISDNIQAIFKNVKQSYLEQQKYVREHDFQGNNREGDKIPDAKKAKSSQWVWWTLGGVGTAAIATTAYYALNDGDKQPQKQIDIIP